MTVDERLEFLLKSTESLHASTQELHSSMVEVKSSIQDLRAAAVTQAESIRQLAVIAASHGDRISSLERKTGI